MRKHGTEISPIQEVLGLAADFPEYEEMRAALSDWSLDFRQLDPGQSPARLSLLQTPDLQLMRVRLSRRYGQAGSAPLDMKSFALVESSVVGVRWCGEEVDASSLLCFARDGGFEAVSEPGFDVYTVSVSDDALARAFDLLELPITAEAAPNGPQINRDAKSVSVFRQTLRGVFTAFESSGGLATRDVQKKLIGIPDQLAETLGSSNSAGLPTGFPNRSRTRRAAIDWIAAHAHSAPRVSDVCEAIGVSRRTLELVFREHFGVSPKAYLTAYRLSAVRSALLNAAPDRAVSEIASNFGFWHMGDFAGAYRRQFGELPSTTLSSLSSLRGTHPPRL